MKGQIEICLFVLALIFLWWFASNLPCASIFPASVFIAFRFWISNVIVIFVAIGQSAWSGRPTLTSVLQICARMTVPFQVLIIRQTIVIFGLDKMNSRLATMVWLVRRQVSIVIGAYAMQWKLLEDVYQTNWHMTTISNVPYRSRYLPPPFAYPLRQH